MASTRKSQNMTVGRRRWFAIASIVALPLCSELPADSAINRKVSITSHPSAATVCKKVLAREECYGRTPLQVSVELEGINASSKFIAKKIGFVSKEFYVDAKTTQISIRLETRNLFYDPNQHKDANLSGLQLRINAKLKQIIYSSATREPHFELVGQRRVYKSGDRVYLSFPILVNSYEVLTQLKRSGRIRNQQKRYASIMNNFDDAGVFPLFDDVVKGVAEFPVDAVVFSVVYSKSQSVLDFEQVEHVHKRYVSSYHDRYGDVVQRVDKYELYTTTEDVTVVKDRRASVNYDFAVDLNLFRPSGKAKMMDLLDKIEIVTNDNHKNARAKIEISTGNK